MASVQDFLKQACTRFQKNVWPEPEKCNVVLLPWTSDEIKRTEVHGSLKSLMFLKMGTSLFKKLTADLRGKFCKCILNDSATELRGHIFQEEAKTPSEN